MVSTMAVAMPTQTARIPWVHLAVLVSQDTMGMDWTPLVRQCSRQSLNLGLNSNDVLDLHLEIEVVAQSCFGIGL